MLAAVDQDEAIERAEVEGEEEGGEGGVAGGFGHIADGKDIFEGRFAVLHEGSHEFSKIRK